MNRFVSLLVLIALLVLQAACSTTTTTEQKQADMAGKTDSTQRAAIHTERAAEYYRLGSMAVALEAAKQSVAAQSSYAPAHNMLALIYMELREDSKAQASFEQAIRLAPNFSDAINNYGWFICQRLTPQRSLPYFEQAIRDPLYTTPHRAQKSAQRNRVGSDGIFPVRSLPHWTRGSRLAFSARDGTCCLRRR